MSQPAFQRRLRTFEDRLRERIHAFGGNKADFNFAADLLMIMANETTKWARSYEDAMRIPDTLQQVSFNLKDAGDLIQRKQNKVERKQPQKDRNA